MEDGDEFEIVHFVGGGDVTPSLDTWTVAGRTFRSRLILGTGKYKDFAQNAGGARGLGCRDRHRRGAPRQRVGPQCADAHRFHRSEKGHLPP